MTAEVEQHFGRDCRSYLGRLVQFQICVLKKAIFGDEVFCTDLANANHLSDTEITFLLEYFSTQFNAGFHSTFTVGSLLVLTYFHFTFLSFIP